MAPGVEARRIRSATGVTRGAIATTHRTLWRSSAGIWRQRMSDWEWPEERVGLERASFKWWVFLVLGVASIVIGVILLLDLFAAVATLALLVALGFLVGGISEIMTAGRYRSVLGLVAGAVLVLAGIAALAWPDITLWALAVVTGIGLIVSGVMRIMGAVSLRLEGWGWLLVGGIISVVIGIMALVWPDATILALGILLGLRMLLFGISEVMFGLSLHAARTIR
jgi:uncharacterized membrane protein HdeD (DUF308 family)